MGPMGANGDKPHVLFVDRQGNHHYDRAWKQQVVAAALEPEASLSRVAIDHGINTNMVRKWVRKHYEAQMAAAARAPSSGSSFVPVRIEPGVNDIVTRDDDARPLNLKVRSSGETRQVSARAAPLCSAAKLNVTLPNGVTMSLECDDVHALTAVIGAVGHV